MSIYGTGTDLCSIARIARAENTPRFAVRVLHPLEYALYQQRRQRNAQRGTRFLASRFAAREALFKAMGTGFRAPAAWHACHVLPDALGKPVLTCNGALHSWMAERRLQAQISLSDEADFCLAFCILEQTP